MTYKTFLKLKLLDIESMQQVLNPLGIKFDKFRSYWYSVPHSGRTMYETTCPVSFLEWIQINNGKDGIKISLHP